MMMTDNVFRFPPSGDTDPDHEKYNPAIPESEDWLAVRFVDAYGKNLRYVSSWSKWIEWHSGFWKSENTLKAYNLARRICREASNSCKSPVMARTLAKTKTISAVEILSRADRNIAATEDQWDLDELKLNLRPHLDSKL
jgi:putative DNA primase/helicase